MKHDGFDKPYPYDIYCSQIGAKNTISFQKGEEKMIALAITGIDKDGESFKNEYSTHSGYMGIESPGNMGYQTVCRDTEFLEFIRKAQDNGVTNMVIEIKD
tara:strand:- start:399 stop:701 length:303 start_codon:yes stop_codon:yes gene_type:complete